MSAVMMLAAEGDEQAEVSVSKQPEAEFEEQWKTITIPEHLGKEQKMELKTVLQQFNSVFQDMPGEAKVAPFKLLSTGIIVPSSSPWASPIVPVPKPDGQVRMCIDYRALNAVTESDVYPLSRIDQLLEEVGCANYITTLDLVKGYYQFPVGPEHHKKTAFVTPAGKWEFRRMPFVLKGASAAFQREMNAIFQDKPN